MTEAYKEFLAKVSEDEALRARVEALDMSDPEAAVKEAIAIAAGLGLEMAPEDFVVEPEPKGELSDDELAAVAGGGASCACATGGYGGTWGDTGGKCICAMAGGGAFKSDASNYKGPFDDRDADGGCGCLGMGGGGGR